MPAKAESIFPTSLLERKNRSLRLYQSCPSHMDLYRKSFIFYFVGGHVVVFLMKLDFER